jgi:hypothetical protein
MSGETASPRRAFLFAPLATSTLTKRLCASSELLSSPCAKGPSVIEETATVS